MMRFIKTMIVIGIGLISINQYSYAAASEISLYSVAEDETDQAILEDAWTLYWQEQRLRFFRIKNQLKNLSEAEKADLREGLKEKIATRERKKSREQSCEMGAADL